MAQGLVVLRKGSCDLTSSVNAAKSCLPIDRSIEPLEVDAHTGFDPDDPIWREIEFLSISEDLRKDEALRPFILSLEDCFVRLDLPGAWPWYRSPGKDSEAAGWTWVFTCNVCGAWNRVRGKLPHREEPSCAACKSTVRYRATVRALIEELVGENAPLSALSPHYELRGLGISDWQTYAKRLSELFTYTNTYLDSEPRLDLTDPPRGELTGAFDFAIAGDVFEHVAPPVESAMTHLLTLLRPGGIAIVTVPITSWPNHIEHFPALHHWRLDETGNEPVLVNERADGSIERFTSLCFHGPGRSLEMRVFTEESFLHSLRSAGFVDVHFSNKPSARHGILLTDWPGPAIGYAPRPHRGNPLRSE